MFRRSLAILPLCLLTLLTGCGKRSSSSAQIPAAETEPEYSIVVEDVTQPQESDSTAEITENEAAEPASETTAAVTEQTNYDAGELTETTALVTEGTIDKDGVYTTKDDVALYLYTYGELPKNFITKKEAQALGWEGGSLEPYAPGCCIGGTYFGNYEGNLPEKRGREYHECDIDTLGKNSRGSKRIVYSNDGLIYYTADHYNTFELLYGEETT